MQRHLLLIEEMIDAARQAHVLATGLDAEDLMADRLRRDALLWNFTVLGEAANQVSDEVKTRFPDVAWNQPTRLRNRIVHGYWSIDVQLLLETAANQLPQYVGDLEVVLTELDG